MQVGVEQYGSNLPQDVRRGQAQGSEAQKAEAAVALVCGPESIDDWSVHCWGAQIEGEEEIQHSLNQLPRHKQDTWAKRRVCPLLMIDNILVFRIILIDLFEERMSECFEFNDCKYKIMNKSDH